jgi:hypothetical protein
MELSLLPMNRKSLPRKSPISRDYASDMHSPGATGDTDQETLWQRAQRRALAYLQTMGAPTLKGHELVMEALKGAYQTIQDANRGDPVKETIQILRRLLDDRGLFSHGGPQYGRWFRYGSLGGRVSRTEDDHSDGITSMPPMKRGFMSTARK